MVLYYIKTSLYMYQIYLKYLLLHVPRPSCPSRVSVLSFLSLHLVSCIHTYIFVGGLESLNLRYIKLTMARVVLVSKKEVIWKAEGTISLNTPQVFSALGECSNKVVHCG